MQSLRAALLFVVITAAPAIADPVLDRARENAQVEKMMRIGEEIHLEKSQEKAFWKLYENYQSDLRKLTDKRIALVTDAKKVHQSLTDAQASELIRRALALEEHRLAVKRRHVGLFLEKLPARVVARYFQLENKIQSEVNAELAERMPLVGD